MIRKLKAIKIYNYSNYCPMKCDDNHPYSFIEFIKSNDGRYKVMYWVSNFLDNEYCDKIGKYVDDCSECIYFNKEFNECEAEYHYISSGELFLIIQNALRNPYMEIIGYIEEDDYIYSRNAIIIKPAIYYHFDIEKCPYCGYEKDKELPNRLVGLVIRRLLTDDLSIWEQYYSLEQLLIFYEMGYSKIIDILKYLVDCGYIDGLNYRINIRGMVNTNVN